MQSVSIHIVIYNNSEHIVDCLEAILKQSYPIEQNVITDNASNDDMLEKVQKWSERSKISTS